MSDVSIHLLQAVDTDALFAFETQNRAFFARVGFPRADEEYELARFQATVASAIEAQAQDTAQSYLIRDDAGLIVGRVNLLAIERGGFNKAKLGYRVGEAQQGKGYATRAVGLLLTQAVQQHRLHRLEAGTSPTNIGSQIVLIKNGFQFVGRCNQYIHYNGEWRDSLLFDKVLD